jgi:hypothetical protein
MHAPPPTNPVAALRYEATHSWMHNTVRAAAVPIYIIVTLQAESCMYLYASHL